MHKEVSQIEYNRVHDVFLIFVQFCQELAITNPGTVALENILLTLQPGTTQNQKAAILTHQPVQQEYTLDDFPPLCVLGWAKSSVVPTKTPSRSQPFEIDGIP